MERVAALQGPFGLVSYQRIIKFIWREVVVSLWAKGEYQTSFKEGSAAAVNKPEGRINHLTGVKFKEKYISNFQLNESIREASKGALV